MKTFGRGLLVAFLALSLQPVVEATPEEIEKKARETIIPIFEIREFTAADALEAAGSASGIKVFHDQWKNDAKITVKLSRIPAAELFRYLTNLAGLKFRFESDGVHVVPAGVEFGPLK